jgi:hypothetical protein
MGYKEVANIIETGLEEITALEKTTLLPENPDMEYVNNFIYEIYSDIVKNG